MKKNKYTSKWYDSLSESSYNSAQKIVPLIIELVNPKSVVDIGCGSGVWLKSFIENGTNDVLGIDGQWVKEDVFKIPYTYFSPMDLNKEIKIDRQFDLAISMEVAEHLNNDVAEGFVKSIVQLAPVILFSSAIPNQGGTDHLNEQWPEYWKNLFAIYNYQLIDCIRPVLWENSDITSCYIQNSFLYINKEYLEQNEILKNKLNIYRYSILSLVHPLQYKYVIEREKISYNLIVTPWYKLLYILPSIFYKSFLYWLRNKFNR